MRTQDESSRARELADGADRVGLGGGLVVAVADHPGEAQRHAAGVAGGALHAVEGDLDDLLGPHVHDVRSSATGSTELGEPLGLPGEHLVGHPLERLAQHHEPAGRGSRARGGCWTASPAAVRCPLDRQHHQVEGVHRLDLDPRGAAAAGVVRRARLLTTTPSWPGPQALVEERLGAARSSVTSRGTRCGSGTSRSRAASRSTPGASRRSSPSRCSRSKKYGVTATPPLQAVRDAVSWNGRGRPSSSERQRLAVEHEPRTRAARADLDHLGQPGGDVLERAGGDPDLVAVAVHLDADAVELHVDRHRAAAGLGHRGGHVGALEASIGSTGRPTSRPNPARASSPPVMAATTTCVVEPASIAARRTEASGTPAAAATASWTSASRAPWRTSPVTTRAARPARRPWPGRTARRPRPPARPASPSPASPRSRRTPRAPRAR